MKKKRRKKRVSMWKGKMETALMAMTHRLFLTPWISDTHSKFNPFSSFERLKPVFKRFVYRCLHTYNN